MDRKEHVCCFCSKTFVRPTVLYSHSLHVPARERPAEEIESESSDENGHTGTEDTKERPFVCEICFKSFSQKNHLWRHLRVHTKERPFACELCPKSFSRRDSLKVHRRVHTEERPYECETCGKSFSQSYHLSRHMLTHTKDTV